MYIPFIFLIALAIYLYHMSSDKPSWASQFFAFLERRKAAKEVAAQAAMTELSPMPPDDSKIIADRMVPVHLDGGKATLLMRERRSHNKCTAHLIVWAGKRRKGRRMVLDDSHYDLCVVDGCDMTDEIQEAFIKEATNKLHELVVAGMKKQRTGKAIKAPLPVSAETPAADMPSVQLSADPEPLLVGHEESVAVQDPPESSFPVKLKKYPSIFRGQVLFMGEMERTGTKGASRCYGVRFRTPEGKEEVAWGIALRSAFREAGAGVDDHVEIVKIGRKLIEQGKAPMNVYNVAKLSPEQLRQNVN